MEQKTFDTLDIKATDDGIVEAIVSVFNNVDRTNERVMPGAFTNTLLKKLPKIVWMHNPNQPVGKTLEAAELKPSDNRLPESLKHLGGLYVKGKFNLNTQTGKEAFSNIKEGIIDEFSIGYRVEEEDYRDGVRELKALELFEWSPVLVGANQATALLSAKSRLNIEDDCSMTAKDIERYISHLEAHEDMRKKEGRTFSAANLRDMMTVMEMMRNGLSRMEAMINAAKPKQLSTRLRILQLPQLTRN